MSEDPSFDNATIQADEEINIIEIDKNERIDNFFKVVIRLVQKPEITFVFPESINIEGMKERYAKVFRNTSNIKCLTNRDSRVTLESEFQYPNKTNFFIYLIDIDHFENINHFYQMMKSNKLFYSVILCGNRPRNSMTFFPKKISELQSYLNTIKNITTLPAEIKETIIARCVFLLNHQHEIQSCFENGMRDFNFSTDLYFNQEIIYEISEKMFNSCGYIGVIGNRDGEESKKLISKLIPKKGEESKMGNIYNITHVEKFAGETFNDYSHTEVHNDYRSQIANIANYLEHSHILSESEKETIGKLKECFSNKSEYSESLISKVGAKLRAVIGISKDTIPTLDFIIKHKDVIMETIGTIIP